MAHGQNIHKLSTYMDMATMCLFTSYQNVMPNWKYVLHFFDKCPGTVISGKE